MDICILFILFVLVVCFFLLENVIRSCIFVIYIEVWDLFEWVFGFFENSVVIIGGVCLFGIVEYG